MGLISKNNNKSLDVKVNDQLDDLIDIKPQYKKMLNNLLELPHGSKTDNSVFCSSKINNHDLIKVLSKEDYKEIFDKPSFRVEILNVLNWDLLNELEKESSKEKFLSIIEENEIDISATNRKQLKTNFRGTKAKVLRELKKDKTQMIVKWKQFKNNYLTLQEQTNEWPLYIGTMFAHIVLQKTKIYAPLVLKKVLLKITSTNKIYLESIDDSIELNEKILFLLQNKYKFNIPELSKEKNTKYSLHEGIDFLREHLQEIAHPDFNFVDKFKFKTNSQVRNIDLKYSKGIMLTIHNPIGKKLRNKMIELILDKKMDSILDFNPLENIQKKIFYQFENKRGIYRIAPTDLSQEYAIAGSLIDSSIIWGPPGTGKSQTICNILSNLLVDDKTVLVISQKKAALDVIKERMGKLSKFICFGLVDKNVSKKNFYKPFQELIDVIKIFHDFSNYKNSKDIDSSLSEEQLKYYFQAREMAIENFSDISNLIYANKQSNDVNFLLKNKKVLSDSINVKNVLKFKSLDKAIKKGDIKKGEFLEMYPKDIRVLKKYFSKLNGSYKTLESFHSLKNKDIINNFSSYLENEHDFITHKKEFLNNENYLEFLLAERFDEKIKKMKKRSKNYEKKLLNFLKDTQSEVMDPNKFLIFYSDIINELFTTFISTPKTLTTFIDMTKQYDYVIFDEASQIHVEKAIPFIGMAKKTIIAGDPQQMRPTSFFVLRDKMIEENEQIAKSLIDFAYNKGLSPSREYMLTKNYRSSSSELMIFSSKHFYKSKLDTVSDFNMGIKNPIEIYKIDGKWINRMNEKEARALLDYVKDNLEYYETIILLTLNIQQLQYINLLLFKERQYTQIARLVESEKIKLRNLENIQGDEADLVCISIAYDKTTRFGSTYVARPEGKFALNVAISRAKEKMVVFKSVNSDDIKPSIRNNSINLFKSWLNYLELSIREKLNYISNSNLGKKKLNFDITLKEDVYKHISKNIKLPPNIIMVKRHSVGSRNLDIAFLDSRTEKIKLGLIIISYRYRSYFKKFMQDVEKMTFLEAKGYPLYKITEFDWTLNKEKNLEKITSLLKDK